MYNSCVYFGPNLIFRSSKKQSLVARSNTEAQYCAIAHTTCEILWIESLLTELHVPYQTRVLLCGNISVVIVSDNFVLHARTKHIELDIHFVREKAAMNKLLIQHIPSTM